MMLNLLLCCCCVVVCLSTVELPEEEFLRVGLRDVLLLPQLPAVEGAQQTVGVAHADGVALDQRLVVLAEVLRTHTLPLVALASG